MKTIKTIISSPFFLSLIPFCIIVLLIPFKFNKYLLEIENTAKLQNNFYIWYDDLNGDGNSEKITAFTQNNYAGITIFNEDGVIDQWNFRGKFDFSSKKCLFISGDKNGDGKKEIYVFTINYDTIFLHIISDLNKPSLQIKNRFIAVTGKGINNPDPCIIPAEMDDLDGDGVKELIFGINSGLSYYPRKVFAYFISKDSIIESPESSCFLSGILQSDINNDRMREIIPSGYASGNITPDKARYHDYSSFLMVLDKDLKFLFEPIEFKGEYSGLKPAIWNNTYGNSVVWLYNPRSTLIPSTFYFINQSGKLTDSVPLSYYALNCLNVPMRNKNDNELLIVLKNGLGLLNNKFELTNSIINENPHGVIIKDFDLDGRSEILVPDSEHSKVHIYREGLLEPATASISLSGMGEEFVSMKVINKAYPLISIQSGQNHYLLKYGLNPAYPYYYLYFPGIYLGILAFALSIKHIQNIQIRKAYETEKKISELQLALIRNQLDPHFTMNVINSIIYSVEFEEKEQAGDQLRKFANLYRNMLMSAGSTQRTLAEELDFCTDYLLLEKMRFSDDFNFTITVSDDVNRKLLIPKLLIQIHAENAVKHGLSTLEKARTLNIDVKNADANLLIDIVDNGIGREKAAGQSQLSTGKGLAIMDELYGIYNKYYNQKISSQISDLYDPNGVPSGTKVCIRISCQNEKG